MAPVLRTPPGVRRVFARHEARLRFYADGVLPGGCFFLAAQTEFDEWEPGPAEARGPDLDGAVGHWLWVVHRGQRMPRSA